MADDKKTICPDCGKEVKVDDDCTECGYPLRYHNARARVRALEERIAQEKAEKEKNEKPSEKKHRPLGGIL